MPVEYVLRVPLHPGQLEVARHEARFKVLACGRRWGKTTLGVYMCFITASEGGRAWWVAPSFPVAKVGWRSLKTIARKVPDIQIREGEKALYFPGGGSVVVRSADNPDSLRGEGLNFCVIDEAAFVQESAWLEALRPALSDRIGHALIISTPKGRNWFWRAYQMGRDELEPDFMSWTFPSNANPFMKQKEVDDAQKMLPESIFQQEYLAVFLEDSGTVFRNIENSILEEPAFYNPYHRYVMGIDWGRYEDFTCLIVVDVDMRQVVAIDHFKDVSWPVQQARVTSLADGWHVNSILAESNAMGEPNIDALRRQGLPITGFTTTARSKEILIESLQLAFERYTEAGVYIRIPRHERLVNELRAFEMERMASGWRFSAPSGMHDDCVIALALAYQASRVDPHGGIYV